MNFRALLFGLLLVFASGPAAAESAREILTSAAFAASDKATALARIEGALKSAEAALARSPVDQEARLQRALAISYRGKLTRSRSDLVASRREFEAIVASHPRNAEAQMALAGWHLGVVTEVGSFVGRTVLGARTEAGREALSRSLTLGGDRAFFPAIASLLLIRLHPGDVAGARKLAEAALKAKSATPIDRLMQMQAAKLLPSLRAEKGKAAAKLAELLLPFGRAR